MESEIFRLKQEGNQHYQSKDFFEAKRIYSDAINLSQSESCESMIQSQLYANRAACCLLLNEFEECVSDCDKAIELQKPYPKVRLRKVAALKQLNKFNDALKEIKNACEEDPEINATHRNEIKELEQKAAEETERLKNEALGSLKDLGNKFLGMFGMSTDNFKLNKNGEGGYNIQFVNNKESKDEN